MEIFWLTTGFIFMALTLVMVFVPRFPAAVTGYVSMICLYMSGYAMFEPYALIFWAIAVAIAEGIRLLLPRPVVRSTMGVPYISGGALAGMAVGMLANTTAGVVAGAMAGAVLGGVAFARTAKGASMEFPSWKFFNYLAAKGLPVIVALSAAGVSIVQLLILHRLNG